MTNYEKIKAMSVEEMVDVILDRHKSEACKMRCVEECIKAETCRDCVKALLLQEAEE